MAEEFEEPDFKTLKKKAQSKKEKKDPDPAADVPKEAEKKAGDAPEDGEEAAYLNGKKKKPKKEKAPDEDDGEPGETPGEPSYSYDFLLQRVCSTLKASNPRLAGGVGKYSLKPPKSVVRHGAKKCAFTNFKDICAQMKRPQKHLKEFFFTELGTTGSLDGNDCLILRGHFTAEHIKNLLRKYIGKYVQCTGCHFLDTRLEKDLVTRRYSITCKVCGASQTVEDTKAGYVATSRGERKKARAAGGK